MHVLTVDTTVTRVSFGPLMRKVAMRTPLSRLAAGRPRLVAATNTGYFDFSTGAPDPAIVNARKPIVARSTPASVVGFDIDGRVRSGTLALTGTVTSSGQSHALVGINVLRPYAGLTAYTPLWGSAHFQLPDGAVGRYVDNGVIKSGTSNYSTAPTSGYLLVARGDTSVTWLKSLKRGAAISMTRGITSNTSRPFRQAYSVGAQIVKPGGVALTNLSCRRRYPMPARTAIGYADHGHRLILLVVDDDTSGKTNMHGLDANQTARVMADLGTSQAYLFDGSGSTEMLARMPSSPTKLTRRNVLADGQERPMPLGLGIFYRR
jgi:hypothetical protein